MAAVHLTNNSRDVGSLREFIILMNPLVLFQLKEFKQGVRLLQKGEREYMVTYRMPNKKFDSKTIVADNIINATTLFCAINKIDIHDVVEVMEIRKM